MTVNNHHEPVEIISSTKKRKRWTPFEKQQIVNQTYHPGVTVSFIARKHGIPPSQLFTWRKAIESGGLTAVEKEEKVVPLSQVKELERHTPPIPRAHRFAVLIWRFQFALNRQCYTLPVLLNLPKYHAS